MDGNNQEVLAPSTGWGGPRAGAGRPTGSPDGGERLTGKVRMERLQRLERMGVLARTSKKVMHALGDAAYWLSIIERLEKDSEWNTIVDVLKFHQQMDEGRPAQQINVTSMSVSFSAEEIARARSVVRELVSAPESTVSAREEKTVAIMATPFVRPRMEGESDGEGKANTLEPNARNEEGVKSVE